MLIIGGKYSEFHLSFEYRNWYDLQRLGAQNFEQKKILDLTVEPVAVTGSSKVIFLRSLITAAVKCCFSLEIHCKTLKSSYISVDWVICWLSCRWYVLV